MELGFSVQLKVQKPVVEVFDGVFNPGKLSAYFLLSQAPLVEGTTVTWSPREHSVMKIPVKVLRTVAPGLIRFSWAASEGVYDAKAGKFPRPAGYDNEVEFTFEALAEGETLVKVTEGVWKPSEDGLQASYQNCQGWMNMLCCLKAYLEYGIDLRKGSF